MNILGGGENFNAVCNKGGLNGRKPDGKSFERKPLEVFEKLAIWDLKVLI